MNTIKSPCEEHHHLNKKYFRKQSIVPFSLSIFGENVKSLLKNGIIYYDYVNGLYYYPLYPTEPNYYEIKQKLMSQNEEVKIIDNIEYLTFKVPFKKDSITIKIPENKRLEELKETIFYPTGIIYNDRIYYLIQYTQNAEKSVPNALLEYFSIFKDVYGPLSFRIEEIGNAEDFVMFLSRFEINLWLTEIKISIDSNENFSFIMQNLSMDPIKFTWIDINREGVFMSDYEKMFKTLRLHLVAYVEDKCDSGKCYFITIYEEKTLRNFIQG